MKQKLQTWKKKKRAMQIKGLVYMYTNKINGKRYIGLTTKELEVRNRQHVWGRNGGSHFNNAIKKYGIDSFTLEVLDRADTIGELNKKEVYWISHYNTISEGYNLTSGGRGSVGYKHTKETKVKLSAYNSGENNNMYGREWTEEQRRNKSESMKGDKNHNFGKEVPEETIQKRKESIGDRYKGEGNPNYGNRHSEETKAKMRKSHKDFSGGKHPQAKSVIQLSLDGVFLKEFPSSREAFEETGIGRDCIARTCRGENKRDKDFLWIYKDNYTEVS